MARIVSRTRVREGRGVGERLTEIVVVIMLVGLSIFALRWYFKVYLHSPSVALGDYLGAVKAGNVQGEWDLLSQSTKSHYQTEQEYKSNWHSAQGLAGRIASFTVANIKENGDRAEADVALAIRKTGQELYQASSDSYNDHYVLVKESGDWKVKLEASKINSDAVASHGNY